MAQGYFYSVAHTLAPLRSDLPTTADSREKDATMPRMTPDEPDPTDRERERKLEGWTGRWNELRPPQQGERALPNRPPPLSTAQQDHLDALYDLVVDDLRRLAATAKHRWLGDSSQDRVYILFERLVAGLVGRKRPLASDGNIRALLIMIASRRSIDMFRRESRQLDRQVELTDDHPPSPTEPGLEESVTAQIDAVQIIQATLSYWATLPWPDREIMQLRHSTTGSRLRPFASIAAHLGPRHKPDTVASIYTRTLERTREHLRKLGLLDDKGTD